MSQPARRSLPPWLGVAAALFAVGWGANQFTPLLLAYRQTLGLSATTVDALFLAYAGGLIPALFVGGALSDRHGRRALVLPATAASAAATLLLAGGRALEWGLPALYGGRLLAGVVSGLVFAPGTAWVKELSVPPYDVVAGEQSGARRAAVALSGGFGLGALAAGMLAQVAPAPLVLPYLVHLGVLASAVLLLRTAPDVRATRAVGGGGAGGGEVWLSRAFLLTVAPAAPWVFGAASLSFAVLPTAVAGHTRGYGLAFAGTAAGLTLLTGVLVQPAARRLDSAAPGRPVQAGLACVVSGALIGALAAERGLPLLALAASLAFGAGYGLCLVGGLLAVQRLAGPHVASLTASYYALTYLGFAAPLLLAAVAPAAGYPRLLLGVAGLAALTLVALAAVRSPGAA